MIFFELYFSESCPLSESTIKSFNLAGFLAHVQQFSRLLDKFEVWVSCEAVCDNFDQFFCLIFLNGIQSLPDLLNTRFTIVEIGLFYGGEHLGAKICRFLTCFDKITSRWRFSTYLIGDGDV